LEPGGRLAPAPGGCYGWHPMTSQGFAIFCLVGFLLPVPLLAWLDRRPRDRAEPPGPPS